MSSDYLLQSVYKIRSYLRKEAGAYRPGTELGTTIRTIRHACRRFCRDIKDAGGKPVAVDHPLFLASLEEFKTVLGQQLQDIEANYGLQLPENLARFAGLSSPDIVS